MKIFSRLLTIILIAGPSISFFRYHRPVQAANAGQNYAVIDEAVWKHARPDLGDLRLYAGQTETPYALVVERGSTDHAHKRLTVFQQSVIEGKTQFFIDMTGVAEYDHVDLTLDTKNFVAHARVDGQDDLHARHWALLGDSILYDLSRENLGRNTMLRLPRSAYRYLRVTIDGPVKPEDVQGAASEMREEQKAVWRDVDSSPQQSQDGNKTLLKFQVPENVPVEKLLFDIAPGQPNFRRQVEIRNEKGEYIGSGEINRIHMVRAGQKIDSDDQDVEFSEIGQKTLDVRINNGDDPPLQIRGARLQQLERRIYFNPPAQLQLTLYYGDEKLDRPVYDYAKLFQKDSNAALAQLGTESPNPAHTGRPDDRPWSERHPVVLWIAIIAAVLVLGAIALKSMRAAAA